MADTEARWGYMRTVRRIVSKHVLRTRKLGLVVSLRIGKLGHRTHRGVPPKKLALTVALLEFRSLGLALPPGLESIMTPEGPGPEHHR